VSINFIPNFYGISNFVCETLTCQSKSLCLEVLTQLANAKITRSDVVTQVRTQDLTVVCASPNSTGKCQNQNVPILNLAIR